MEAQAPTTSGNGASGASAGGAGGAFIKQRPQDLGTLPSYRKSPPPCPPPSRGRLDTSAASEHAVDWLAAAEGKGPALWVGHLGVERDAQRVENRGREVVRGNGQLGSVGGVAVG